MAPKLEGRAFYESIGSPKHILAPMVDQSEFAWRELSRSFLPPELEGTLLSYTPMFHARMFVDNAKYRAAHFEPLKGAPGTKDGGDGKKEQQEGNVFGKGEPYLDGNREVGDRPLFVQFCANDPDCLLEAAKMVQPYCDAVDLNLGCPQGIAKKGRYGAFLQEDWDTIYKLINTLHKNLDIPITAKMRILETRERTLEYANMILSAGASIITVHGRQRDQKGHNTGLADWKTLRFLRESLPEGTVMFANGNILQHEDLARCLEETTVDGIMSAEGNLYDPSIFAPPPKEGTFEREYFRGRDGKCGWRVDAVLRRYLDIIHKHVLCKEPPERAPLFLPSDKPSEPLREASNESLPNDAPTGSKREAPSPTDTSVPKKKQKREEGKKHPNRIERTSNPNLVAMQAHCFHFLRSFVSQNTNVRDALARCKAGDIEAFENVLILTEEAVKAGLLAYEADPSAFEDAANGTTEAVDDETASSVAAVKRCKKPYWVCQPFVRPLPKEALEKGSLQLSKKEKKRLEAAKENESKAGLTPGGTTEVGTVSAREGEGEGEKKVEVPKEGLVCG
ncbi:hypothetical protein MBLNU230_g1884t1 [Neophaeotheca triangularis]